MGIAAIGTGIAITIDVIATMIITTITMITMITIIITTIMMITITAMTMATRARYPWAPERLR
jgi:hypothetical protein